MQLQKILGRVGRLFPRNAKVEAVQTTAHLEASPDAIWKGMLFYEEVPHRASAILRLFLPAPVRTEGDKLRVGSIISCTYEGGRLMKQITSAVPGRRVSFDVLVQELGIEDCISMNDGAYEIRSKARGGADVVLTTRYRGHIRPRWLARSFERFLAHRMHDYILAGMRDVVAAQPAAPVVLDRELPPIAETMAANDVRPSIHAVPFLASWREGGEQPVSEQRILRQFPRA